MNLPVDEMLLDLRYALEAFGGEPCSRTLDAVFAETRRIADTCETIYVETDVDDDDDTWAGDNLLGASG